MPSFRVTLAYDGSDFEGWQSQRSPQLGVARTVQGVVEDALARLAGGTRIPIAGAGRTDAGVHALGQVASFDLPRDIDAESLVRAMNGMLPPDVRVLTGAQVSVDFHARRSAVSKRYRYEMDLGPVRLPTRRRIAGYHRGRLDGEKVLAAAALYLGRHDFATLASSGSSVKTTVRTVVQSRARLETEPVTGDPHGRLVYEVAADGFLRKMVRSMVGGLVAAGSGAVTIEDLRRALQTRQRRSWPPPAEPCGLTLVSVEYP